MSTATLDASLTRLDTIKGKKNVAKNKIAEAEALAAEALRMANEAKLAAARLAEVKKTLSMFSNKLEKAEQSVQKDMKVKTVEPAVVEEAIVEEKPVEIVDSVDVEFKNDPPTTPTEVVSKNLVNDDVVKVYEVKLTPPVSPVAAAPTPVARSAPKEPVVAKRVAQPLDPTPAPVQVPAPREHDIVEDFLDGIGLDKACGVDDATLGFTDRPDVYVPPPPAPKIFENPTRIVQEVLSAEDMLQPVSIKVERSNAEREQRRLVQKHYQRVSVNEDFNDPFGVDHDDLVMCGKIADVCEPPDFEDAIYADNSIH